MSQDDPGSEKARPIWFPAKRYGWGWGVPFVWQGGVVLVLWVAALVEGAVELAGRHWIAFAVFMVVMCGMMIAICYARGERPRWRWGK